MASAASNPSPPPPPPRSERVLKVVMGPGLRICRSALFKAFVQRGWVVVNSHGIPVPEFSNLRRYYGFSAAKAVYTRFDMIYANHRSDIEFNQLEEYQVVNVFEAAEHGKKGELAANLEQLCMADLPERWEIFGGVSGCDHGDSEEAGAAAAVNAAATATATAANAIATPHRASWWDADNFFPRQWDLVGQRDEFIADFKFGHCVAVLRCFVDLFPSSGASTAASSSSSPTSTVTSKIPIESIRVAMAVLERRLAWSEGGEETSAPAGGTGVEPAAGASSTRDVGQQITEWVTEAEWDAVGQVGVGYKPPKF